MRTKPRRVSDEALNLGAALINRERLSGVTKLQDDLLRELELFLRIEVYRRAEAKFVAAYYAEEKKTRRYQGRVIMDEAKALWRSKHPRP